MTKKNDTIYILTISNSTSFCEEKSKNEGKHSLIIHHFEKNMFIKSNLRKHYSQHHLVLTFFIYKLILKNFIVYGT